jgi:RNA polymerase sigma factor (sigma-70 family)
LADFSQRRRFTGELKMTETRTLLAEYARKASEEAFGELAARYLGLVYATALRLVGGDAQLAEDATQTVFVHLARKARGLPGEVMLGGWLHRDTCHVAATLMRAEHRRKDRERRAMELQGVQDHSEASLAELAPVLDEAIDQLGEQDRLAIMLRFFEQRDLRSVGKALGSSENAAQKRVSRALESLRILLKRRGVALSVGALGAALSTGPASASVPTGLAASVAGTALAGAAAGGSFAGTAIELLSMTNLKLCLAGAVVVASLVVPLVVQHQVRLELQAQDERMRRRAVEMARLAAENLRLGALLAHAHTGPGLSRDQFMELLRLRGQVGQLRMESRLLAQALSPAKPAGGDNWADKERMSAQRLDQLKQWLGEHPAERIPDLQLLSDRDWLDAVPAAENGFDAAMSLLRENAEFKVTDRLFGALGRYEKDNNGRFPTEVAQLKPYLDPPLDDAILDRYTILPATSLVPEVRLDGDWVITEKAPVNAALDHRIGTGLSGWRVAGPEVSNRWELLR